MVGLEAEQVILSYIGIFQLQIFSFLFVHTFTPSDLLNWCRWWGWQDSCSSCCWPGQPEPGSGLVATGGCRPENSWSLPATTVRTSPKPVTSFNSDCVSALCILNTEKHGKLPKTTNARESNIQVLAVDYRQQACNLHCQPSAGVQTCGGSRPSKSCHSQPEVQREQSCLTSDLYQDINPVPNAHLDESCLTRTR